MKFSDAVMIAIFVAYLCTRIDRMTAAIDRQTEVLKVIAGVPTLQEEQARQEARKVLTAQCTQERAGKGPVSPDCVAGPSSIR